LPQKQQDLHRKITVAIVAILGVSFYLFYAIFKDFQETRLAEIKQDFYENITHSFELNLQKNIQDHYVKELSAFVDNSVLQTVAKQERETLLSLTQKRYEELVQKDPFILVGHFHLANGRTLLRLHNTDFYGDEIGKKRFLLKKIHKEHKPLSGFERGESGFYYRTLLPLFLERQYIGAFELGIKPKKLLEYVSAFNDVEGLIKLGERNGTQVYYKTKSFEHYEDILPKLDGNIPQQSTVFRDGETFAIYSFDIMGVEGDFIGEFVFFQDLTRYYANYNKALSKSLYLFALISIGVFILLYFLFYRFTQISDLLKNRASLMLNAQENMVLISQEGKKLLESNSVFLDFFGFKSLADFSKKHSCVCDLFLPQEGYLQKEKEGSSWIKDIILHPNSTHLAKMKKGDVVHTFRVYAHEIQTDSQAQEYVITFEDITQELSIQKELEAERDLFSEGPVVTIEWSPQTHWPVRYVSANVTKELGYTPEEMKQKDFVYTDIIHPQDKEEVFREVEAYIKKKQLSFEQSYRLRHKNGEYRWFYDFTHLLFDEDGVLLSMRGYMFDQSEMKKTQKLVASQKERLENIIEGTNVGTWEWNIQTGETVFNDKWAQMIGYTLEEISPTTIETWIHFANEKDLEASQESLQKCLSGAHEFYEAKYRMKHKDGHEIWVYDRGKVSKWDEEGNALFMSGTHTNIDVEEKLKEEIEKNQEMLQELFDNMKSGVAIYEAYNEGEDFIFKDINKASMTMENISKEDVIGMRVRKIFPGIEQMGLLDVFREVYKTGVPYNHPVSHYEDGRLNVYRDNFVYKLSTGDIVAMYDDVTEQKKTQEALTILNKDLKKALEAKSQFLANMSHEIRTPMNAILGLSELLKDTNLDAKQLDFLDKIYGSSRMLLRIINDILDFSKLEAGKLELEHKAFSIESIFAQLRVLFTTRSAHKGLELYFYKHKDLPAFVVGDELRLEQIVTNLLSNALKFTHEGIVLFSIKLKERLDEKHVILELSVKDSGIGISQEQQKKLFLPFSQADSSTTRKFGGTGLGLMISSKIAEAMGSKIELESTIGEGSCFFFDLECEVASWKESQAIVAEKNYKVLIVDDQEISREILAEMLEDFGCTYDEASDGVQAIEKVLTADAKGEPYDFVLIDWLMPNLDGKEATKRLCEMYKAGELKYKIPSIMMVSAHLQEEIGLEDVDVDTFLPKPVTSSTLLDAMMQAKDGFVRESKIVEQTAEMSFDGVCILLIEDNEINQEVATLMLERVGIDVMVANNGKEGVSSFFANREKIDLILMDLQMPVMSGYEATQEIRREDKEVPIIALTAAAMVEDREKVLAAGMNDHLGKPIDTQELYQKLSLYLQDKAKQGELEILSESYLQKTLSSQELIHKLLKKFLKQLESDFSSVVDLVASGDAQASKMIHALKGVSGNLGAQKLAKVCTVIDAQFKAHEPIEEKLVNELSHILKELREKLKVYKMDENNEQEHPILAKEELNVFLEQIIQKLSQSQVLLDSEQDTLLVNLRKKLSDQEFAQLQNALDELELEEAIKVIEEYRDANK
jgi:PAS domain S-box-containing protein